MSSPDITRAEREAVAEVLRTPFLSMGPQYRAFEAAVCEYTGTRHAIAVNSGTAGLHLCVRAAGIKANNLVITSAFSFAASSNVMLFENAVPVFVDADPVTGNIDPSQVHQAVKDIMRGDDSARKWLPRLGTVGAPQLKAIMPIDIFGQPADMDPILEVARGYQLKVIEDSCEAIGAQYKGRYTGTLGDYAVFAFYPNKQMTTGEGGVIVTDDDEAAVLMRSLRNQGRAPGDTWLDHTYLGYNYRMDEMSAALGRVQVGRLDELITKRARVATWYNQHLAGTPGVELPQVVPDTTRMSWFLFVVRLSPHIDRDAIIHKLAVNGIPARSYFAPIHLQPYMVERFGYKQGDFPVTEDLGRRGLALPFSSVMTEEQVEMVCSTLHTLVAGIDPTS
jgi:dTDP-4-amino-4,6-dideoxygalactose transaminase